MPGKFSGRLRTSPAAEFMQKYNKELRGGTWGTRFLRLLSRMPGRYDKESRIKNNWKFLLVYFVLL